MWYNWVTKYNHTARRFMPCPVYHKKQKTEMRFLILPHFFERIPSGKAPFSMQCRENERNSCNGLVIFIHVAAIISTTVLVPENCGYIFSNEKQLFISIEMFLGLLVNISISPLIFLSFWYINIHWKVRQ